MKTDSITIPEAFSREDAVVIDVGSRNTTELEMFFWLHSRLVEPNEEKVQWCRTIPDEMSETEAEYYALVKALRVAAEQSYSAIIVSTNSVPILDHLREENPISTELKPFYEEVIRLRDEFDTVELMYYAG